MMIYLISVNAFIILTHLLTYSSPWRVFYKNIGMKLLDVGLELLKKEECTHKEIKEGFKLG